jgi:hypothetical protein
MKERISPNGFLKWEKRCDQKKARDIEMGE